ELWKSDGTPAGTRMVKDINPAGNSSPQYLTNVNGTLFFAADDGVNGSELWKSDGTAAGTVMVKDIFPSFYSSYPGNLTNVNRTLYFSAYDGGFIVGAHGRELWKSDGTTTGTTMVKDIFPGDTTYYISYYPFSGGRWFTDINSSNPGALTNVNGTLFFLA